jgi:hypothetical protein
MKTIKGLKIAALVPLGWMAAVLLLFAVGETLGGDWSGVGHLLSLAFVGLVMWLGWKRPLWGGILLLAGAIFETITFAGALGNPQAWLPPFLIMILPLILSGLLLLGAARLERKAA